MRDHACYVVSDMQYGVVVIGLIFVVLFAEPFQSKTKSLNRGAHKTLRQVIEIGHGNSCSSAPQGALRAFKKTPVAAQYAHKIRLLKPPSPAPESFKPLIL